MAQVNVNALGLSLAGRPSAGVEFEVVRDLTQADLASISAPRQAPKESRLKALRARHHRLARLLATGTKPGDAGSIVGYSASRVSILQSDPAFQELLAFYADKDQEAFMETRELLADVARDALGELQERLEDTPEDFSNRELLAIVEKTADRSGNGPTAKVEHNHTIGLADRLAAARQRQIEGTYRVLNAQPEEARDAS